MLKFSVVVFPVLLSILLPIIVLPSSIFLSSVLPSSVLPSSVLLSSVLLSSVIKLRSREFVFRLFNWTSIKMRCTDRELPTVEDRCERCDLTPVQYSNRRVAGTVRASLKKGSVAGEASAERQKSNTDRDC